MTLDLSHLPTALRERAFDSNQDRIRQVKVAIWVGYTRANRALERHPKGSRGRSRDFCRWRRSKRSVAAVSASMRPGLIWRPPA
jgi:hypothetical protein